MPGGRPRQNTIDKALDRAPDVFRGTAGGISTRRITAAM